MAVKKRLINDNLLSNEDLLTNDELAALEAENKGTAEPVAEPAPKQEPAPKPATPAPAEPAQQQPEPAAAKPEDDRIPKPRFNEVISERNELRAQVKDLTEKWARFDERKKLADEAVTRFNEEKKQQDILAQRPDETIDPGGARLFDLQQVVAQERTAREKLQKDLEDARAQFQTQGQNQEFQSYLNSDLTSFRMQQADYPQAATHATTKRAEALMAFGLTAEEAEGWIRNETLALASVAQQRNRSAAAGFYEYSKLMGYQPQNGNGTAQPTATPAPAKAKLEQIRAGQSMQGLGGNTPRGGDNPAENLAHLSPLDIANMDEEDFVALLNDPVKARAIQQSVARAEGLIE